MVVHPHPLSPVQFPLVLVSPRICHPDEKSFRRLNQGRFSPGCTPPRSPRRPWISLLFPQQPRGGYRGLPPLNPRLCPLSKLPECKAP
ncbi:hypothetical protein NQZ68_017402 [Dissostichus eleginoides]|nr:hypothetical protein NQZ68_017402 [Dissostichus eleginoides]